MFKHLRGALPACALAAASLFLLTPTASAAGVTEPAAIYSDINGGHIWVYDGAGSAQDGLVDATVVDIAVSPDGRTAYLLAYDGAKMLLIPRDVATGKLRAPIAAISTSGGLEHIALSRNGATAWVTGSDGRIYRVTLSSGAVAPLVDAGTQVRGLAVSPKGDVLYASVGDELVSYSASTGARLDHAALGQPAGAIKVSADGRTAFVVGDTTSNTGGAKLFKVSVPALTLTGSTDIPGNAAFDGEVTGFGLALSPDQDVVYVAGAWNNAAFIGRDEWAFVVPVLASDLSVGAEIVVIHGDTDATHLDLAFTPDGSVLYGYLSDRNGTEPVFAIDTASNTLSAKVATTPPQSFDHHANFSSVVVPADQAPVAKFKAIAACAGTATAFDASSSTVAQGKIVRYAWDFGDGTTKVTTGPKVKHTYAKPGSYAATVTETDTAGTSTTVVFDGQTVLRNGKPTARAHHTVTITACAVSEPTIPSSGSMAASSADASLPMTGGNTTEALILSGLLIGAGAVLTRAGRRVRG